LLLSLEEILFRLHFGRSFPQKNLVALQRIAGEEEEKNLDRVFCVGHYRDLETGNDQNWS
jgi:hypothetical protein